MAASHVRLAEPEWRGYDESRDSDEAGEWDQSHAAGCVYWPDCQANGDHPNPHIHGPEARGDERPVSVRPGAAHLLDMTDSRADQMAAVQQAQMILFLAAWKRLVVGLVAFAVVPALVFEGVMTGTGESAGLGLVAWFVCLPIVFFATRLVPEAPIEEISAQFARQQEMTDRRGGSFATRLTEAQERSEKAA